MRFFLPVDHVLPGVDMETAYTAARASAKAKRRAKAGAAAEDEVDDDEDAAPDASVVLHSLITDAADINGACACAVLFLVYSNAARTDRRA